VGQRVSSRRLSQKTNLWASLNLREIFWNLFGRARRNTEVCPITISLCSPCPLWFSRPCGRHLTHAKAQSRKGLRVSDSLRLCERCVRLLRLGNLPCLPCVPWLSSRRLEAGFDKRMGTKESSHSYRVTPSNARRKHSRSLELMAP
jgi:hypothetical protein